MIWLKYLTVVILMLLQLYQSCEVNLCVLYNSRYHFALKLIR